MNNNVIYVYNCYEYEDNPLFFASMPFMEERTKIKILKELDLLYGDTNQETTNWCLEYQLWTRMLLHYNALMLNPVHIEIKDVEEAISKIIRDDVPPYLQNCFQNCFGVCCNIPISKLKECFNKTSKDRGYFRLNNTQH